MFRSKRSVLRTLAAVLEATNQAYHQQSRGYRHSLAKEEHYRSHLRMTLQTVMAGMAQALSNNDREAAKALLESLATA
jgi:hypothetical protein